MIKAFENREKLIEKYIEAIGYVSANNGNVDNFVAYEMIVANAFRGGSYVMPASSFFDIEAFKADYIELFGEE